MSVTQQKNRVQPDPPPPPDPRIAFFDHQAPLWDKTGPNPVTTLERLRGLEPQLGLQPGQEVLELGCGTGQITAWLLDCVRPGRVVAADFSPAMLKQARARDLPADWRLLDICCEKPVIEWFDVIFCFSAFPHFRDKPAALRQISCSLAGKGQLIILHLAGSAQLNAFHQTVGHPVNSDFLPSSDEWPGLLAQAGLELLEYVDKPDLFLLKARCVRGV